MIFAGSHHPDKFQSFHTSMVLNPLCAILSGLKDVDLSESHFDRVKYYFDESNFKTKSEESMRQEQINMIPIDDECPAIKKIMNSGTANIQRKYDNQGVHWG